MFTSDVHIRVRYAETDQMGYVYYGNYAAYYEVARVEALRKLGVSYKEMEENGIMLPVAELKSKYHAPATFDELLNVKTYIKTPPKASVTFIYNVFNASEKLLNEGETKLVFVNKEKGIPCKAPEYFINKIMPYFQ